MGLIGTSSAWPKRAMGRCGKCPPCQAQENWTAPPISPKIKGNPGPCGNRNRGWHGAVCAPVHDYLLNQTFFGPVSAATDTGPALSQAQPGVYQGTTFIHRDEGLGAEAPRTAILDEGVASRPRNSPFPKKPRTRQRKGPFSLSWPA